MAKSTPSAETPATVAPAKKAPAKKAPAKKAPAKKAPAKKAPAKKAPAKKAPAKKAPAKKTVDAATVPGSVRKSIRGAAGRPATRPPVSEAAGILGQRIRSRRLQLGLTLKEAAERSGFDYTYLGQIERGAMNATLHNILRVAEFLEVEASDLISGLRAPRDD